MKKAQERKSHVAEMRMLRWMSGVRKRGGNEDVEMGEWSQKAGKNKERKN